MWNLIWFILGALLGDRVVDLLQSLAYFFLR